MGMFTYGLKAGRDLPWSRVHYQIVHSLVGSRIKHLLKICAMLDSLLGLGHRSVRLITLKNFLFGGQDRLLCN